MQASNWKQIKCILEISVALFGKDFSLCFILDRTLEVRQYLYWILLFPKQRLNLSIRSAVITPSLPKFLALVEIPNSSHHLPDLHFSVSVFIRLFWNKWSLCCVCQFRLHTIHGIRIQIVIKPSNYIIGLKKWSVGPHRCLKTKQFLARLWWD